LPINVVAILKTHRLQHEACTAAKGCVTCGELIGEQTKRPSIAYNVVQDGEHYVRLRGEPQQNDANQGPPPQIEWLIHLLTGESIGLLCEIRTGPPADID